jgi:hypothetical protein
MPTPVRGRIPPRLRSRATLFPNTFLNAHTVFMPTTGRPCSICSHPQAREISADLFSGMSYRAIQKRFAVTPAALCAHLREHVAAPLRRLCEAERRLADDAALVAPSLLEMRLVLPSLISPATTFLARSGPSRSRRARM